MRVRDTRGCGWDRAGARRGRAGLWLCTQLRGALGRSCALVPLRGTARFRGCGAVAAFSGLCLSDESPVRVCSACRRQPELIIVVVTVSPLILRIPLPPARRGLQINKSSLGAGASKLTYAPADGSSGTFARSWGRPWSPRRVPDPEAPTPGCQTTLPCSGSGLSLRWLLWPGTGSVCGTAQPCVPGKCRETLWGAEMGSPNKAAGMPGGSWGPGPARVLQ